MKSKIELEIEWPEDQRYKYAAADGNGEVFFYTEKPKKLTMLSIWASTSYITMRGKVTNFKSTLQERPKP